MKSQVKDLASRISLKRTATIRSGEREVKSTYTKNKGKKIPYFFIINSLPK